MLKILDCIGNAMIALWQSKVCKEIKWQNSFTGIFFQGIIKVFNKIFGNLEDYQIPLNFLFFTNVAVKNLQGWIKFYYLSTQIDVFTVSWQV